MWRESKGRFTNGRVLCPYLCSNAGADPGVYPTERAQRAEGVQVTINGEMAARFIALNRFDDGAFERLNRYETGLWRQVGQLLVTLEFLRQNQRL